MPFLSRTSILKCPLKFIFSCIIILFYSYLYYKELEFLI
nr:MAG TPA: hypothetical protein [Caudoviricetes sp.]DAY27437.1 MAG TPA: hypothetical protein [Caudoviricetes sp.]